MNLEVLTDYLDNEDRFDEDNETAIAFEKGFTLAAIEFYHRNVNDPEFKNLYDQLTMEDRTKVIDNFNDFRNWIKAWQNHYK